MRRPKSGHKNMILLAFGPRSGAKLERVLIEKRVPLGLHPDFHRFNETGLMSRRLSRFVNDDARGREVLEWRLSPPGIKTMIRQALQGMPQG